MTHPNLEDLSLHDEEEEGFCFDFEEVEDEQVDLRWCLVGRFLCERSIHFNSMKVRMADLWKPVKGVTIKEATGGKFLFHFAHPIDMEAVLNGGPWTFDNNMLILEQVQLGMQIERIPLFHVNMWVQVHNLPMGLMRESVGNKLANYIGAFMEYDKNNQTSFWRQYMRVRVKVDVRLPLKKEAKVKDREGNWGTVKFKYEKLGVFCFVCGIMGHAENKCVVRFEMEEDNGVRDWSSDIRAETRRQGGRLSSRWLREEKGGREEAVGGNMAAQPQGPTAGTNRGHVEADVASNEIILHSTNSNPSQPRIMTRQNQSLAINANQAHTNPTPNHNSSASKFQINPSFQSLIARFNQDIPSTFNSADSFHAQLPTINIPSSPVSDLSLAITQPETENFNSKLLPNQAFTFTSQSTFNAQPTINPSQTKHLQGSTLNPFDPLPLPKPVTDPKLTRPKKSKINPKKINPTHHPNQKIPRQNRRIW
jgi:hypothetical protein